MFDRPKNTNTEPHGKLRNKLPTRSGTLLPEEIRAIREASGDTMRVFADRLGYVGSGSISRVYDLESGAKRPSRNTQRMIMLIANGYHVPTLREINGLPGLGAQLLKKLLDAGKLKSLPRFSPQKTKKIQKTAKQLKDNKLSHKPECTCTCGCRDE